MEIQQGLDFPNYELWLDYGETMHWQIVKVLHLLNKQTNKK